MVRIILSLLLLLCLSSVHGQCIDSLWNHVYRTQRFTILDSCITVTGTVFKIKKEKDGDYHIDLKPEDCYRYTLAPKNYLRQNGCLVLEIICALRITQTNAIKPCENYIPTITVPKIGDNVTITGTFVIDKHHGWTEIHPVSKIVINE
jgi:hypothetical protein